MVNIWAGQGLVVGSVTDNGLTLNISLSSPVRFRDGSAEPPAAALLLGGTVVNRVRFESKSSLHTALRAVSGVLMGTTAVCSGGGLFGSIGVVGFNRGCWVQ